MFTLQCASSVHTYVLSQAHLEQYESTYQSPLYIPPPPHPTHFPSPTHSNAPIRIPFSFSLFVRPSLKILTSCIRFLFVHPIPLSLFAQSLPIFLVNHRPSRLRTFSFFVLFALGYNHHLHPHNHPPLRHPSSSYSSRLVPLYCAPLHAHPQVPSSSFAPL